MPSKIFSAALTGIEAELIEIEADSGGGDFGQITIVGLPDAAVSEAKERVRSALKNCGLPFPRRKITVNLAPANLKKHGPIYDLPIALSILALQNKFSINWRDCLIAGELSLDGTVRPINGVLALAIKAKKLKINTLFVPTANAAEAKLIKELKIFPIQSLSQLISHLQGRQIINPQENCPLTTISSTINADFALIAGQAGAKRALEIAAAGGHNILLFGPPGSGKTLLAKATASILPALSWEEQLEVTTIYSVAGQLPNQKNLITVRPWRAPHHSASLSALVGGGSKPQPGEISLAHRGILFLDEIPEFSRSALESLRQPLEEGFINISRASGCWRFPAKFSLIAAMNPCPCGYWGETNKQCHCSLNIINNYHRRLSGPILERFDMQVAAPALDFNKVNLEKNAESSITIRKRVQQARRQQIKRFKNSQIITNSELTTPALTDFCSLDSAGVKILKNAVEKFCLSARSYGRLLKLARTIADLAEENKIQSEHLAEALQYRPKLD